MGFPNGNGLGQLMVTTGEDKVYAIYPSSAMGQMNIPVGIRGGYIRCLSGKCGDQMK